MTYDEDLVERLRLVLADERLSEKSMFGGLAFLVDGHMAVAASSQGGLMVRTDPAQTSMLLREPGAETFEMRGRAMKGWLRVSSSALEDDDVLRAWAARGLAYARSLPRK